MKNLVIIGAGNFAREVFFHAQFSAGFNTEFKIKGFLDGDKKLSPADYEKLPAEILGDIDGYKICEGDVFTCAIAAPNVRRMLIEKMLQRGADFINIVANDVYILPTAEIGRGVIIIHGAEISTLAKIGDFVILNSSVTVGHDSEIGNFSCVMPQAVICGGAKIGAGVFIGANATLIPNVKIGDGAYIGAGSVVLKKVKSCAKVFGNPAVEI